jgi:tetratricopeptide (TPR) repeat protein
MAPPKGLHKFWQHRVHRAAAALLAFTTWLFWLGAGSAQGESTLSGAAPDNAIIPVRDHFNILTKSNQTVSLKELNRAVLANSRSMQPLLNRGQAYLKAGEPEEAMKDFRQAAQVDKHSALPHIGISRCFQQNQEWPQALAELDKAMVLGNPVESAKALLESAFIHREIKDYGRALKQYDTVLKKDLGSRRNNAFAIFQRAECLVRMGRQAEALPSLNAAAALDPYNIDLFMVRAQVNFVLKKYRQSLADYTTVINAQKKRGQQQWLGNITVSLADTYNQRANVHQILNEKNAEKEDREAAKAIERQEQIDMPFLTK